MSDNHRLNVLEQQFKVMQGEVTSVIGEMHQGLSAMMNSLKLMAQTYNARLEELEKLLPSNNTVPEKSDEGKEL